MTKYSKVEQTLQELTSSLWDRMRFYKMRIATDARLACSAYNSQLQPELIQDYNDPYRIEWIDTAAAHVLVGEKVIQLPPRDAIPDTIRHCA